ncbi:hypothetical protein [Fulvivirga sediminis]|uniref:Uncharacterized protein n=1 Tax=Fulvivirga sediminis TaxID=2803949 RepID=A0A937K2P7_9BACT|nr:hypothetical protein [Fulvivirga sediminis]MBL3658047.1 hypothetical protein [Fulvivirga sediminis]
MEAIIGIINQVHEVNQKLETKGDLINVSRNISRIKHHLEELGYTFHNPINEDYNDTRTDCEANIIGDFTEGKMYISKVIKPIIFTETNNAPNIIQKAVVIVEQKPE